MTQFLDGELSRLKTEWPSLVKQAPSIPAFTWEELLEALLEQAALPVEEMVVRGACAAMLKMAPFKPPEMLLREILVLVSSSFDLGFRHGSLTAPEANMI